MKCRELRSGMKSKIVKHRGKYGMFSFFTGAGFLDLGFEDAGFARWRAVFFLPQRRRNGHDIICV